MKKYIIFLSVTLGLTAVLAVVSRFSAGFSEWYARNIYPIFVGIIGRIFSVFPFSVAEILLIILILAGLTGLVLFIVKLILKKGERKAFLLKVAMPLSCTVSAALLIYILNCGINYNRHIFLDGEEFGFSGDYKFVKHDDYEEKERAVFLLLLEEFEKSDILAHIQTDENGIFKLTSNLKKTAPQAMKNLAKSYPRLAVYYPPPKPALTSDLMTTAWLNGVFSPYTIEANYNNIIPDSEKIETVLHELAHVAGFMREEEANFIAFLAAKESGIPEFEYTAYLSVFQRLRHVSQDPLTGQELLPFEVLRDLSAQEDFWWNRYYDVTYGEDGEITDISPNAAVEVMGAISKTVNDAYLKSQGQSDGVESYGRMIDLVVAWYIVG
jgi:hypothetical protein